MAPLPSTPPLTTESPPPPPSSSSSSSLKALSIPDRADRLLKALGFFAAQHPLAKPFLSLRSHFQTLIQVHFRIPRFPQQSFASTHSFAAILPGDSVAGLVVANGINNFLNIYNTLLVVRLVLTWFPNSPPAIVSPLSTICDPYLNIFRGIIPPLGGTLDLSPILAFLVLSAFSSTAAALPAELPSQQNVPSRARASLQDLTAAQEKWMKRLSSKN